MYGAQDEPRKLDVTVGPDDSFLLQAHVTSPAYTFAYRWSVFRSDDAVMRWPVATLGYDDAGEGFSLSNNNLTVTAARQGLPPGDYLVKLEARYPATGCITVTVPNGNGNGARL